VALGRAFLLGSGGGFASELAQQTAGRSDPTSVPLIGINGASPEQVLTALRRHVEDLGNRLLPPDRLIEINSDFREDIRTPTVLLGVGMHRF
jgi:hypothetical protein